MREVKDNEAKNPRKLTRQTYSTSRLDLAVEEAKAVGVGPAAMKYGIPPSTLRDALKRANRVPAGDVVEEQRAADTATAADIEPAEAAPSKGAQKKRAAKRYTPSQRAQILESAAKIGISAAAKQHGCTRFAIYDWRRKVEQAAEGTGSSPTSGPDPKKLEEQRDHEILEEWSRHPGLGPSQIRNQLRAKCVKVSVNTVRRVMTEAGYRPPKVERQPHDRRFEAVRPNHLWHLDFVKRRINRATTFTLILIDDHSRFVVGHGVDEVENAEMVLQTFEEAVRRHGRPEMVMHDKGGAFWAWNGISRFTALLTELGIDQIVAEHKEWNGKVEVFNGNLHKEFFEPHRFADVAEMKRALESHLHFYNHLRTHHALGGLLVPADRYFGRADQVVAQIEAGVPRDVADTLGLRDRCLELFKIASTNGVPELWFMGQRVLPPRP